MDQQISSGIRTGTIPGLSRPVSRLFFGTAIPPVSTGEDRAADLLDRVLETGIDAFDCARSYGLAERTLGRWMESRGNRDRVTVLTKCGDVRDGQVKVDRQVILAQLKTSLDELRTDHADIFLLHRDDPATPVEEQIDTMNELLAEGLIRAAGVSNWTHARIEAANAYAAAHGLTEFAVSSPNYSLAHQVRDPYGGGCVTLTGPENREARAWYARTRMPVVAYSGLARGFLSGRFAAGDFEAAARTLDEFAQRGYLCEENMARLARAEQLAARTGLSVPEIAVRYLFAAPMDLFAVVSSSSPARLLMNVRAAAHPLSAEEAAFLETGGSGQRAGNRQ